MAQETLRKLLASTPVEGVHPMQAIFDLDSTLFCVSYRTQQILNEFREEKAFQKKYPREVEALKSVEIQQDDWGIKTALQRTQLNSTEEFVEDIRIYWRTRFFSDEYLKYDKPYEGAVEYLQELHKKQIPIRYITGRNRKNMGHGTVESLKQWNFPLADAAHLVMKPTYELKDEEFKTKALKEMIIPNVETYFFENEPLIINHVRENLPEVKIVFMASVHSGQADPPRDLPTLKMKYLY